MNSIPRTAEEYRAWWEANTDVPYGYCWCGCGAKTTTVTRSELYRNTPKGVKRRYKPGHGARSSIDYLGHFKIQDHGFASPCWIWSGLRTNVGYGQLWDRANSRSIEAHRFFYEAHRGAIEPSLTIDHLCKIKLCVNPEHMELVSHAENTRRSSITTLTWAGVHNIRKMYATGNYSYSEIAVIYNVSIACVGHIVRRERWA